MTKYLFILFFISVSANAQQLNEVCSKNSRVFESPETVFTDWVEIYNSTGALLELGGYSISDELYEPDKWVFPSMAVWPNAYILLSFNDDSNEEETVDFSLPRNGGSLYLFNEDEELVDAIHYPELRPNHSYGRIGEDFFYFDTPTPELANDMAIGYKGYSSFLSVNRESGAYPVGTHIVFSPENESETVFLAINGTAVGQSSAQVNPYILKSTVSIAAIAKGDSLIASEPLCRTYFVDEEYELPLVHLRVDSLLLFDEDDGICMPGPNAEPAPPYLGANFWTDKEVEGHFAYFDENLVLQDALNCDLKIHGGVGSRVQPMKSFQLRAKDFYEVSSFNGTYFEEKDVHEFKRLVLRNSGNDFCKTCLKDGTLQAYFQTSGLNVDFMGYQPVVVYINGQYWGMANLREKSDRYYVSSNYDLDSDEINLLYKDHLIPLEGDNASFVDLMNYAVAKDLNEPQFYERMDQEMDLESMVDYFCLEFYLNNRDWPNNNLKVWNAPGHKWRYLCYDLDYGLRYYWNFEEIRHTVFDMLNNLPDPNPHIIILSELLENENFKRYFINRYADLLNTIFQEDQMKTMLEEGKERIEGELPKHFEKWCGPFTEWQESFSLAWEFLEDRVDVVHEDLSRTFNKPNLAEIKIDNYPKDAGKVKVNTIEIEEFPFGGTYFETNLIDLVAIPNEGEDFDHWENLRTGEVWRAKTLTVDPQSGDEFIAIYRSEESLYHMVVAPNPVGDVLCLNYSLPTSALVLLEVIDFSGKRFTLMDDPQEQSKGSHTRKIDVAEIPSGTYILHLTTDQGREAIRFYKY